MRLGVIREFSQMGYLTIWCVEALASCEVLFIWWTLLTTSFYLTLLFLAHQCHLKEQ